MAWELTGEAFAKLLECFDSDPELAGKKYGELRLGIIRRTFEHYGVRSTQDLDELADATFDRVAKKLAEGERVENIIAYCNTVARRILQEYWKKLRTRPTPIDKNEHELLPSAKPNDDSLADCLDHCLDNLPPETAAIVIEYHRSDGDKSVSQRRQELADRLGISVEALRNRIVRLRNKLEKCINDCQNEKEKGIWRKNSPI